MLENISDILCLITKIFAVYFAVISIFGLLRPKAPKGDGRQLKFAVLIAARNEESCIEGIIRSLKVQNYPEHLCHIYVIPNNCTDNTAAAAAAAGARVLSVSSEVHSKGAALREAMDRLLLSKENYDAFCVFDADNQADKNFLEAMNRTLTSGVRVAKSRILAGNPGDSWVCACYDTYFCNANLFMNRARERLGLSARLIGTGFAVKADFIRELGGFRTETITEDAEFYAICAARGERIAFCEEAVTYDEEPLSFRTSLTQRRRWMSGILQVARMKLPELLAGLLHRRGFFLRLDAIMQFCFGYIQALMPFFLIFSIVSSPAGAVDRLILSTLTGYSFSAATGFLVLALQGRLRQSLWSLWTYPLFILSFIPLQTLSLFFPTTKWREIRHMGTNRENSRNELEIMGKTA